jgi:hypothetical protein
MSSPQTQFDETKLRQAGGFAVYLIVSVLIAYWIGSQDVGPLYLTILVGLSLVCVIGLQRRVWVLILLGWSFTGSTVMLQLPLSIRDMAVLVTAFAYLVNRAISQENPVYRKCALDTIILCNAVYLLWTFVLHPVGLHSLGAEVVGARPYFTICLALVGYFVIWRLPKSLKTISHIPLYLLAGWTATTTLSALSYLAPSLPSRVPYLYAALNVDAYFSNAAMLRETGMGEMSRYKDLGPFGLILLTTLFSYFSFAKLINPLRPWIYASFVGGFCILLAGFRNLLVATSAMFGLSIWLRQGWLSFLAAAIIGGALLLFVGAGQGQFYDLPLSAQRTLSFLPGQWDRIVVRDAEMSTEGRIKWWQDAIKYSLIKDWWFGDGFGAVATEISAAQISGGASAMAEVTGSYHSGPLTTIRYVGVVGLLLFYLLAITAAVYACRCVQKCKGTVLQPVTIFLAIQLVWFPINFTFIFGAYNVDMPQLIFLVALVRLVMRMADDLPPSQAPAATPNPLASSRPRLAVASR